MNRRHLRPPLFMTLARCAEVVGVERHTMARWAKKMGVLVRMPSGQNRVSVSRLRDAFPEVHERICDEVYDRGET